MYQLADLYIKFMDFFQVNKYVRTYLIDLQKMKYKTRHAILFQQTLSYCNIAFTVRKQKQSNLW